MLGKLFIKMNSRIYVRQFKRYLRDLGFDPEEKCEGEDEYVAKWSGFPIKPELYSYRLFSRYAGNTADIVPEAIGRSFIEPVLNPVRFRPYYCDKNLYGQYLPNDFLPRTYARRIGGGGILDGDYKPIEKDIFKDINAESLIIKPSIDSSSGKGVMKLVKDGDRWKDTDGNRFGKNELESFGGDWILQEAVEQSAFMSQFCRTAVNTLRLAVYRSPIDERAHVVAAMMRVGKDGMFVDNSHAGGLGVGIDSANGKLNKYLTDQYGNKYTSLNGVNYENAEYAVPEWDRIVRFAEEVASNNRHLRLLALDICLDKNGTPKLLEYNCEGFSYWLFMFNGFKSLGIYTDEIIRYCAAHKAEQVKIVT